MPGHGEMGHAVALGDDLDGLDHVLLHLFLGQKQEGLTLDSTLKRRTGTHRKKLS